MNTTRGLFDPTPDPLAVAWREFHEEHPEVYRLFRRFALEVLAAGRSRFSARAIFHRIRWFTQIETRDPQGFKINNNHSPFYARMFMDESPRHADLFSTRAAAADQEEDA